MQPGDRKLQSGQAAGLGGGSLLLDRILTIILAGVHFKCCLDELIVRSLEFFYGGIGINPSAITTRPTHEFLLVFPD